MKKILIGSIAIAVAALTLLTAGGASARDTKLEAGVARLRGILDEISRLTPEAIAHLSTAEATRIATTANEAGLALTYDVAARSNSGDGKELGQTLQAFLEANGLQWFTSDEFGRRLGMISARADKAQMDASTRKLESRYPAYGSYLRRVRVKNAIAKLGRAMQTVENLDAGGKPLAGLPSSLLEPARRSEGVRSADYADGRFRLLFDDRVVDGGTLELRMGKFAGGRRDWQCIGAAEVQKFLPPSCKH